MSQRRSLLNEMKRRRETARMNNVAGRSPRKEARAMNRLATSVALAVLLVTPATTGTAASSTNPNAGEVPLDCSNGARVIWVNFRASDLSGGGSPGIVVTGPGRVFKVLSFSIDGGPTFYTRFPAPLAFEPVVCTHPLGSSTVTLTGVFIP